MNIQVYTNFNGLTDVTWNSDDEPLAASIIGQALDLRHRKNSVHVTSVSKSTFCRLRIVHRKF